jgi:hypothetical protein
VPDYREGQTATNPKTGQTLVYRGGQWVNAPAAPGAPAPQRKFSPQEQKVLNETNAAAQEARSVKRDYDEVAAAQKRLDTGPWRGTLLDAAIPTEDGGILDALGGFTIGGISRLTGAIDDKDVDDYNTVRRVQARRVLAEQKQQKGVQTEGDAARIKAGDIGVRSTANANKLAIARGRLEAQITIDRANFMTQWANKYGVNGVNEKGYTAAQVFDAQAAKRRAALEAPATGNKPKGPTIKRIK